MNLVYGMLVLVLVCVGLLAKRKWFKGNAVMATPATDPTVMEGTSQPRPLVIPKAVLELSPSERPVALARLVVAYLTSDGHQIGTDGVYPFEGFVDLLPSLELCSRFGEAINRLVSGLGLGAELRRYVRDGKPEIGLSFFLKD